MPVSTPQTLRQGLYLGWAFTLCLTLIAILGAREDRQAIQTVGRDTAPSVTAAEHIKSALSAMDANAANELLIAPGHAAEAVKSYDERRAEASRALIAAAENIAYGESERTPILKIQLALGEYEVLVQQARDYHASGDAARRDAAYLKATAKMDDVLWPAADALDKAGLDMLEDSYKTRRVTAGLSLGVLMFIGLGFLGVLIVIQVFLFRRTNRVLNPGLIAATLLTFAFLMYAGQTFTASMRHLKVAREDAFISLHALWRARAVAYRASADESRFLLLRAAGEPFDRDFSAQIDSLAKLPESGSYEEAADRAIKGKRPGEFTGYLADELNNITFKGEAEAAKATLIDLRYYVTASQQIRGLVSAGKRQEAIAQAVEKRNGHSSSWFEQFDRDLGRTLEINQKAFDAAVGGGFRTLVGFEPLSLATGASLCLLLWLGIRPRLKEYQV